MPSSRNISTLLVTSSENAPVCVCVCVFICVYVCVCMNVYAYVYVCIASSENAPGATSGEKEAVRVC